MYLDSTNCTRYLYTAFGLNIPPHYDQAVLALAFHSHNIENYSSGAAESWPPAENGHEDQRPKRKEKQITTRRGVVTLIANERIRIVRSEKCGRSIQAEYNPHSTAAAHGMPSHSAQYTIVTSAIYAVPDGVADWGIGLVFVGQSVSYSASTDRAVVHWNIL